MARFRATTGTTESRVQAEGKRTGVVIQSQDIPMGADGLEDEDAFFAGTASPLNNKENPRPSKKMARFSLDPNQVARSSSSSKPQDHPDAASGPARLLSKLKQGGDRSWSPSELSRVSTAPPSVESSKLRAARETVRTALASPASVDEMEESVIPPSMAEDDDTHFLATQDDDEEEDDLMPPEPPQSPEDEDEESQRMLTQEADDDMMPTQMDSFEEDEDDGPGHTMASGKTPQSAKMLRKKSKKTKESKKRKKVQVVESSDDESKKPATKKASRPKKSKYASIFSPKGIPLPLEYETVPVTDLKSTPPEGVRRSKRARTEPLAFWKNEKAEYGPNDDEDANADVALMPVVKAFIKAKATPYKPRVFRPRPVSTDKTKASWVPDEGAAAAAVLPFDSRKLRKKHDFVEGQSAVLWNEHVDEAEELST
jgi:centromere protein C